MSALEGLHLHLDPSSGIAGDMTVAALVDLGVPPAVVTRAVRAMGARGLRLGFERRRRGAYVGRGFVVSCPVPAHGHEHRPYAEIKRLLDRAKLDARLRALAGRIFERLARVEGELHGVPADRVAFHEVGAYDSIADVVGAAAALAWLRPASVSSTPPALGTGSVETAHGIVPVPAPATAALLRGAPALWEGPGELTTPTGAAILAEIVDAFGPPPPMRIRAVGYGAGTRDLADRPNVLRVTAGEPIGQPERPAPAEVVLIESNIDDMSPQLIGPLFDALFAAGALDVWAAPILMKKGRPAVQVASLAEPSALRRVEAAFFRNSTTLGLRIQPLRRTVLARSVARVETGYGRARVKIAALEGEVLGATPEIEDCKRLAARARVPVREVWARALASAIEVGRAGGRAGRRRP